MIYQKVDKEHGKNIKEGMTKLGVIPDQRAERKSTDDNVKKEPVKTSSSSWMTPVLGMFRRSTPATEKKEPVPEFDTSVIGEQRLKKEDYIYNEQTRQIEAPRCAICTYELDDTFSHTPCFHYFHKDCLKGWFKNNNACPV